MARKIVSVCSMLGMSWTAFSFTQMDVSRVLLMNDDTNTVWAVRGQGYFSTNTADEVYWVHSDEEVPAATTRTQALWLLDKTLLADTGGVQAVQRHKRNGLLLCV